VRVEVKNSESLLKPEMFANGIISSTIAGNKKDFMIPKTAVLWTGKRAVVYVKLPGREQPTFLYRQIVLGPSAGEFYVVSSGLQEGEEIAINGVFKIDASAQLAGKPSMMNPPVDSAPASRSQSEMNMSGEGTVLKSSKESIPSVAQSKQMISSRNPAQGDRVLVAQKTCPVMGGEINKEIYVDYQGKRVYFCCAACPPQFNEDPAKFLLKLKNLGEMPETIKM
jgi:YHS domain-containing protein